MPSPGFTLVEPWEVTNGQGQPFKVFTPFSKAATSQVAGDEPEGVPEMGASASSASSWPKPTEPAWAASLAEHWTTGEAEARELWTTGYMHNRVRMVVGSFLTKNLGIHWRLGEEWFWDTLVDADAASNPFNWQWVAGCGDDAAPFFRIFNPETQAQRFDPKGGYVRRWAPTLSAPPIVDLKESRQAALDAYAEIKD